MKNKILTFRLFLPLLLAVLLTNCRQIRELSAFSKCEFRLASVQNTTLAGVNVQNVRSINDLNLLQAGKITTAYASGSLPLNLLLNIDVRNPNAATAALNSLEWI